MDNSDLFLELFDDELLKPQENLLINTSLKKDENSKSSLELTAQNDNVSSTFNVDQPIVNSSAISKTNKTVRTDFDLCAAMDKIIKEDKIKCETKLKSLVHSGDTDSSDDEDNKYMDSSNYNEFGRDIKRMMQAKEVELENSVEFNENEDSGHDDSAVKINDTSKKTSYSYSKPSNSKQMSLPSKAPVKTIDVYADPFFGIRIVNPLISSQGIQMRMNSKTPIILSKLSFHLSRKVETDFVTAGVLARSVTKQSQNETQYMIWEICDMTENMLCIPVFLFGRCYKDLWKTQVGTVVAILNPTCGNRKGNKSDSFSVSVKYSDQVMIWGRSKDLGTCKSMKKNGEKCTAFINKNHCEHCIYHVKKEYSKFQSSRSEVQSPVGHSRNINFLRNKVLGKNEVFYGGKSYSSLKPPALSEKAKEKAKKLNPKDKQRLSNLGFSVIENKKEVRSQTVSLPLAPRAALALKSINMDSHILKSLSSPSTYTDKNTCSEVNKVRTSFNSESIKSTPSLTNPNSDLNTDNKNLKSKFNLLFSKNDVKSTTLKSKENIDKKENSSAPDKLNNDDVNDSTRNSILFNSAMGKSSPKNKIKKKLNKEDNLNELFTDIELSKNVLLSSKDRTVKNKNVCDKSIISNNNDNSRLTEKSSALSDRGFKSSSLNDSSSALVKRTGPVLSDPSLDLSDRDFNGSTGSLIKNGKVVDLSDRRDDSLGSLPKKCGKCPSLSDPSTDLSESCHSSLNSDKNKDLQKRFKNLLGVTSGQKRKQSLNNENLSTVNTKCSIVKDGSVTKSSECNLSKSKSNCATSDVSTAKIDVVGSKTVEGNASTSNSSLENTEKLSTPSSEMKRISSNPLSAVTAQSQMGFQNPSARRMSKAKARALAFVKRNGPISKEEPVKKSSLNSANRKRNRSDSEEGGDEEKVVFSELFMQLMVQTSSNQDQVESERLKMEEEYFAKMGLKEQLEEKMLNTFKIDCKAVKCLQCKYIWFSAAEVCKIERHTLKIVDTVKRFFKCSNCGNRTVSLHIIPMFSCKNCQCSNWQRAPMMREKISKGINQLSIRGGEQQFINSHIGNSNLNLLVPE